MVEYGRLENDYLVSREFESHHVRLIILGFFLSYLKQSNSNLSLRLHILFIDNRLILNHPPALVFHAKGEKEKQQALAFGAKGERPFGLVFLSEKKAPN